jgi:RNA polymerase primary sigma factor
MLKSIVIFLFATSNAFVFPSYKTSPITVSSNLLTENEETILFQNIDSNNLEISENCHNEIFNRNIGLVKSISSKYYNTGLERDDLFQEGCYGLIKAIDRFNVSKCVRFSTYATYWIKAHINVAIKNQGRIIRLPIHIHDKIRSIKKKQDLNLKEDKIDMLKKASKPILSLDTNFVSNDNILFDEENNRDYTEKIDELIHNLDIIERTVFYYRYFHKYSQKYTATLINLTIYKISDIEKKIRTKASKFIQN